MSRGRAAFWDVSVMRWSAAAFRVARDMGLGGLPDDYMRTIVRMAEELAQRRRMEQKLAYSMTTVADVREARRLWAYDESATWKRAEYGWCQTCGQWALFSERGTARCRSCHSLLHRAAEHTGPNTYKLANSQEEDDDGYDARA